MTKSDWEICEDAVRETLPILQEDHNPLDIPFGHEVNESEKPGGPEDVDEGGIGSGPDPGFGEPPGGGATAGPLMTFETSSVPNSLSAVGISGKQMHETIVKQLVETKIAKGCGCHKNKR